MMFRYISMPKLVAWYLREFCVRADGEPSLLYRFVFCLCLPFVSQTFYKARLNALAIAECTNSCKQITRVLNKITGATIQIEDVSKDFYAAYDGSKDSPDFLYGYLVNETAKVTYNLTYNNVYLNVTLNGASQSEVAAYLQLLVPFYINLQITYN